MTYNPWDDLAVRHARIHVEFVPLAPTRAAVVLAERVILIDSGLSKVERRCALAHEVAHIDAGDAATGVCWFSDRQETYADRLAAERLVPLDELLAVSRWASTNGEAAEALGVTLDVLVLRSKTMCAGDLRRVQHTLAARELVA